MGRHLPIHNVIPFVVRSGASNAAVIPENIHTDCRVGAVDGLYRPAPTRYIHSSVFQEPERTVVAEQAHEALVNWLMEEWLGAFAYRVQQNATGAAMVALITSLLIIVSAGYAALRAAMVNPVKVINKV